jgi:sugar diacid utilization regulator
MGLQSVSSAASVRPPTTAPRDCERIEAALEAFRGITDAISGEADLRPLLELVAERSYELISVDRCALYLLDEETGLFRGHLLRARGANDDRIDRLTCGDDADRFTREILATRAPVAIADARRDPRPVRSAMRQLDVRSALGVPLMLRGSVLGIMCLDVEGSRRTFSQEDVQVAAVFANLAAIVIANARATSRLRTVLAGVARQNAALRRAAIAENRLAELVLEGADLDEIAASVAALTAKPCAIYGADGRRIGAGAPPGDSSDPAVLEPEHCARPAIAEALSGLRPGTTSVVGPFRAAGVTDRLLISPVAVGGDEWGRLVLIERGARLTAFDAQVARRAATIVALEISAWRRAGELAAHGAQTLVRDLIAGAGDDEMLRRRARRQGLHADDHHVLCLLSGANGQSWSGPDASAIIRSLDGAAPAAGTLMPEGMALVLGVSPGAEDPAGAACARVEALLEAMPPECDAIAAVSSVFTGFAGCGHAYHEVRQVARCLRTFREAGGRRVLSADEVGAGCLFLAATTREGADEFVRRTLGPLLNADERPMRDLLATLEVFFASSRSVRGTADLVGVHENTIRYRLARITELTGLDVATNADDQLAGQLATLVLRLEGVLHASPGRCTPLPDLKEGPQ